VTRQPRRSKPAAADLRLDPLLAYLVFAAVGVGAFRVRQDTRLLLLWLVLLAASLLYLEQRSIDVAYSLARVGQGVAVGLLLSLPMLLLAFEALQATAARLFPLGGGAAIFQGVVWIAAPVEELFFRAILQREHGFWVTTGLYGLAALVFFLPTVIGFPAVLLSVMAGMAVLGLVYGYVALRYGWAAGAACHVTVNLVLFALPMLWPSG